MSDLNKLYEALAPEPGWEYGNVLPLARRGDELRFAVPNMLRELGVGALDLLQGTKTGTVTPEASNALFAVAGGAPKPSNALGVFGGRMAQRIDRQMLNHAEQMAANGASRDEIWKTTGWFQGTDGKWRFEIPDTEARLTGLETNQFNPNLASVPFNKDMFLDQVLHHPKLFDAYPELQNVIVANTPIEHIGSMKGSVNGLGTRMFLTGAEPDKMLSTALHEVQHLIQRRENFARGGNTDEFLPPTFSAEAESARRALRNYQDFLKEEGIDVNALNRAIEGHADGRKLSDYEEAVIAAARKNNLGLDYITLLEKYQPFARMEASAVDQYRRLAGEVEARNVQERAYMPNRSFLQHSPPYKLIDEGGTMDTPEIAQIVLTPGGPRQLRRVDHDPFTGVAP